MSSYLLLIPVLPLVAAGISALLPRQFRRVVSGLAIGSMGAALMLAIVALAGTVRRVQVGEVPLQVCNFHWLQIGESWVELGVMLDPLTAVMLVMVSLVGLLIFIYSVGYMAHDANFTRFFCFLSLFAAAMLGLVMANSLLFLFICWELVGLTSYLLIGFWFHKPAAAAAAKKAFITTRIGDLALLLGMVWLYSQSGTLLFYNKGTGCLEQSALLEMTGRTTSLGLGVAAAIGLLIFCGAVGKSGQLPLHVWLPDAMEGPTPVSALIHAATMVAAGVFLVARVYPLMAVPGLEGSASLTLEVVTWVGVVTALFAASIAVAQTDIKRILAYSTVSQLGFMMMGLGVGGVAVGMFHLITHAFFKALLFLGAGSVIHGCHEEQDVRCMGGLRRFMPVTFATYAVGMMALSGVPVFFSGFWSKDEILHAAHGWSMSDWPFYLGIIAALLTAFYMTRQVFYVFFGNCRLSLGRTTASEQRTVEYGGTTPALPVMAPAEPTPHESPAVMITPLVVLAVCTVLLGFLGTPAWPWFQRFINGQRVDFETSRFFEHGVPMVLAVSTVIALSGIALGWWFYGRRLLATPQSDPMEALFPNAFTLLRRKYFVDEIYGWTVIRLTRGFSRLCDWVDTWFIEGAVQLVSLLVVALSWIARLFDEKGVNAGFDQSCETLSRSGSSFSGLQNGQVQRYLRIIGVGAALIVVMLLWGRHS